jgi:hypothetical protein
MYCTVRAVDSIPPVSLIVSRISSHLTNFVLVSFYSTLCSIRNYNNSPWSLLPTRRLLTLGRLPWVCSRHCCSNSSIRAARCFRKLPPPPTPPPAWITVPAAVRATGTITIPAIAATKTTTKEKRKMTTFHPRPCALSSHGIRSINYEMNNNSNEHGITTWNVHLQLCLVAPRRHHPCLHHHQHNNCCRHNISSRL